MKIIFDTDGTITDYNLFIKNNVLNYFIKKYNMKIINPNALEPEDIFDMDNFFKNKYNCSDEKAKLYTKLAINDYWLNLVHFTRFSLLGEFRNGASEFLNYCIKNGHDVEIHTSRAKSTENNIIGEICRKFTYLQYKKNGVKIPYKNFYFYKNDSEKIKGIIEKKPDVVFDDKPIILDELNKSNIYTICVRGTHNDYIEENKYLKILEDYKEARKVINNISKKKFEIDTRVKNSDDFFKKARIIIPIVLNKFNPIILNSNNILNINNDGVIYAPNHRSTIDPLILTCYLDRNIHWAALKRFFDGKDSIFNNNKNKILCDITSYSFKKFEYFPIERLRDTPHPNNINSIKDMNLFLKYKKLIGIFPEGTINRPEGQDFGTFDPAFISLAKNNNSWIQPITILWIKDLNIKNKLIVNFGKPFKVNDMTKEEAYKEYLEIQKNSLNENKEYKEKLLEKKKILKKV